MDESSSETQAMVLVDETGAERATITCNAGDDSKGGVTLIRINDDNGRPK